MASANQSPALEPLPKIDLIAIRQKLQLALPEGEEDPKKLQDISAGLKALEQRLHLDKNIIHRIRLDDAVYRISKSRAIPPDSNLWLKERCEALLARWAGVDMGKSEESEQKRSFPFCLETCARPNILALKPYRCARDDYKDDGKNVLLDANENAHGPALIYGEDDKGGNEEFVDLDPGSKDFSGLNRYPDPHQVELKELFCAFRNTQHHTDKTLTAKNCFVGVGSDEAIDAILRCFCRPGRDKLLICPPTYGMYAVSAQVNDIDIVKIPLDTDNGFILRPAAISLALSKDPSIKVIYVTSPGNPTANIISKAAVKEILEHPTWNGVLVIDEAYIDFSPSGSSLAEWVLEWPNLIVMQTLSKAFGLAGIRLGIAFTSPPIASLLNNLKAPYNISSPTSATAIQALQPLSIERMRSSLAALIKQRDRLCRELPRIPGIGRFRGGRDANFVLVEILDSPRGAGASPSNETALAVYQGLAERRGIVVRFRGQELGCEGCLRITVGTEKEVGRFLEELRGVLGEVYGRGEGAMVVDGMEEERMESTANGVIA